jgi:hypothetical protein
MHWFFGWNSARPTLPCAWVVNIHVKTFRGSRNFVEMKHLYWYIKNTYVLPVYVIDLFWISPCITCVSHEYYPCRQSCPNGQMWGFEFSVCFDWRSDQCGIIRTRWICLVCVIDWIGPITKPSFLAFSANLLCKLHFARHASAREGITHSS